MSTSLAVKYRPDTLEKVIGQKEQIFSLRSVLGSQTPPHSFLFVGPSGVGKTTLARIMANGLGVEKMGLYEIDAATHTGVDAMRNLTASSLYASFGKGGRKAYIIDECHALSKQAWQSLLKILEEPPEHVFWFLCTTETGKVPRTIETRCQLYNLKPVHRDDIYDFLCDIAEEEKMEVSEEVLDLLARESQGSVRQAVSFLEKVNGITDRKEAARAISSAEGSKEVIDLARLLVSGKGLTWTSVCEIVEDLKELDNESVRIVLMNYFATVALNTKDERKLPSLMMLMEAFEGPYNRTDKVGPILLSCGRYMFGEGE